LIIFNIPGLIILLGAFGIAFGVGKLIGTTAEGPLMLIAAPLTIASDLFYRLKMRYGDLWRSAAGGSLFFIPVWILGVFWLVLGLVYTLREHR
jgi:hypothetical protein